MQRRHLLPGHGQVHFHPHRPLRLDHLIAGQDGQIEHPQKRDFLFLDAQLRRRQSPIGSILDFLGAEHGVRGQRFFFSRVQAHRVVLPLGGEGQRRLQGDVLQRKGLGINDVGLLLRRFLPARRFHVRFRRQGFAVLPRARAHGKNEHGKNQRQ